MLKYQKFKSTMNVALLFFRNALNTLQVLVLDYRLIFSKKRYFASKSHQNKLKKRKKKCEREILLLLCYSTTNNSQCIPVDKFYLAMRIRYFQSNYLKFHTTHTCKFEKKKSEKNLNDGEFNLSIQLLMQTQTSNARKVIETGEENLNQKPIIS